MAYLPCDKCGVITDTQGSWDTPIRIVCSQCGEEERDQQCSVVGLEHNVCQVCDGEGFVSEDRIVHECQHCGGAGFSTGCERAAAE